MFYLFKYDGVYPTGTGLNIDLKLLIEAEPMVCRLGHSLTCVTQQALGEFVNSRTASFILRI